MSAFEGLRRALVVVGLAASFALSGCSNGAPAACSGGAASCGSNADCGGFQCLDGCCGTTPVCQSDDDCAAGEHCAGGACGSGDSGTSCGSNADCANVAGATKCDLAGTKTCVECVKPSDCGTPAKTCTANKCVDVPSGCASDADCASDPAGPRCKLTSHTCVPCLGNQDCSLGQVCENFACMAANGDCTDNTACAAPTPVCDTTGGHCVECVGDTQCPSGEKCDAHACVPAGCTTDANCPATSPRCDTGTGACVACLTSADCDDASLVCTDHACVANPAGCTSDDGCSGATPHCNVGTGVCVACLTAAQCPDGNLCQAGACVAPPAGCTSNASCTSPGAPICDSTTGACVGCLASTDCSGATAVCNPATHACVGCLANGDCAAGNVCRDRSCQPGCATDADCTASAAGHRCLVATNSCVACLADADCATGESCSNNACVPASGPTGSACAADGTCPDGQLCLTSATDTTGTCETQCDPVAGTGCPGGDSCAWVGFDTSDLPVGACLPKNGEGGAGATCQSNDDCELNLLCMPVSATQAKCEPLCDPSGAATCASGDSCHSLAAYYDDQAGTLVSVGLCMPSGSDFGEPCSSDHSSSGADCGAGMTCGPNPLLADGSLRISTCQYPVGTLGAAEACTDGAACLTGDCLEGPGVCDTSCTYNQDCRRAGLDTTSYKCMPYPWLATSPYTGEVNESETGACLPVCFSDATCAAGSFCMATPTYDDSGSSEETWTAFCFPQLGDPSGALAKAGEPCSADADCESGYCQTSGQPGATDGYCFGECDKTGADQCDPAHGTTCDPSGVGLYLNAGDDGTQGTQDDQYGRAYVCGGVTCTSDADCAGYAARGQPERTCALTTEVDGPNDAYGSTDTSRATCEPAVGTGGAGEACSTDTDCKSGWCYPWGSRGSGSYCMGACASDDDCGLATTCQTYNFGTSTAPNDIDICSPE